MVQHVGIYQIISWYANINNRENKLEKPIILTLNNMNNNKKNDKFRPWKDTIYNLVLNNDKENYKKKDFNKFKKQKKKSSKKKMWKKKNLLNSNNNQNIKKNNNNNNNNK